MRQLWKTARERGEDKVAVPGVIEVLKGLRAAADRRGRPAAIHFISASPPQIGQAIRDKLALDGVPYDGIVFKDQLQLLRRGKFGKLREHVGFKLGELFRGRSGREASNGELLFGDDWESDALTYSIYADVVDGALTPAALESLLQRVGVDAEVVPEVCALAETVAGAGGVERIFINLERRTPPASFRLFGRRLIPAFNYFQTALVLAADGWPDPSDLPVSPAGAPRGITQKAGEPPRTWCDAASFCAADPPADGGGARGRPAAGAPARAWVAHVCARASRAGAPARSAGSRKGRSTTMISSRARQTRSSDARAHVR